MRKLYQKIILSICFVFFGSLSLTASPDAQLPAYGKNYQKITRIESLREIPDIQPEGTIIFFDLDDTLFDFPSLVGSKAWRRYIAHETKGSERNLHDLFSLALAKKYPIAPIEQDAEIQIKNLQEKGYAVAGLTSREREIWYNTPAKGIDVLTIEQLESIRIRFNTFEVKYPELAKNPEYYEGVFFSDLDAKGEYLRKILRDSKPQKILFIDDKLSQVQSVSKVLTELGIEHECYLYVATEGKAERFVPLIANIQLYYFWTSKGSAILSDSDAEKIAEEHPEKDAEHYLKLIIDEVSNGR